MAFCFYRQIYCGIMGPNAGMLTVAVRSAGSKGSLGPSRSQQRLPGNGEDEQFFIEI